MNKGLQNLRVLIVDDSRLMRDIVRGVLTAVGVTDIHVERDAERGLAALQHLRPDVVFLDWEMEPMSGIEFMRRVRHGDAPNPYVPIIMVSAHAEREAVVEARDAGMTEFLAKPVTARTLLARLASVIEHPRAFVMTQGFRGPDRRRHRGDAAAKPEPAERRAEGTR